MNDKAEIEAVVQTYFEGMFESSADKTHAAFHPNARIVGYLGSPKLSELTVAQFAQICAGVQPSAKERGDEPRLEILSLEIAGDTAVALVRDDYEGNTFLDTLSLIRDEGEWRIYNKLFHVEGSA